MTDEYKVGDKVHTQAGGRWHPAVITKPPHKVTGNYGVRFKVGAKTINYVSSLDQLKKRIEEDCEEIDEVSAAAMGHSAEREYTNHHAKTANPTASSAKYVLKHKKTGKVISTHTNTLSAVTARRKLGVDMNSHSIIKEGEEMNEHILDLINAIDTGKTLDIEQSFAAAMSNKMVNALEIHREQIASTLFNVQEEEAITEEAIDEEEVDEGEKTEVKDKDGKVVSWKYVGDTKTSTIRTGEQARGRVANLSDKARRETGKMKD